MVFTKIVSCELLTRAKLNARRIPLSRGKLKVFPHISKRSFCENFLELKAGSAFLCRTDTHEVKYLIRAIWIH